MKFGEINNKGIVGKDFIIKEYSNFVSDDEMKEKSLTILVYNEDKRFQKQFGKFRVWFGKTFGKDRGVYFGFDKKSEALEFAKILTKNKFAGGKPNGHL